MGNDDDDDRKNTNQWPKQPPPPNRAYQEKDENMSLWGIFVFGLIGATATTLAIGHFRRHAVWFYSEFSRAKSSGKGTSGSSFRSNFQEEAWKRYNRRMQEEYEEEMERVERIRRMQSVFNRERNKFKRGYESWRENGEDSTGPYHDHFQRNDWYWKTDASYKEQRSHSREYPRNGSTYSLSHHYSVLGLDRSRAKPYTEAEIKTAFRTKAKQFHPDQNQENKEVAEMRFKEVMVSYEAIKSERKNMKS